MKGKDSLIKIHQIFWKICKYGKFHLFEKTVKRSKDMSFYPKYYLDFKDCIFIHFIYIIYILNYMAILFAE